jgi:hypothetical protein
MLCLNFYHFWASLRTKEASTSPRITLSRFGPDWHKQSLSANSSFRLYAIGHGAVGKTQLESEVHGADEIARWRNDHTVKSLSRQSPRIRLQLCAAKNADPPENRLITTAFVPASLAETIRVAASSARSGRTVPTVRSWETFRD